MGKRVRVAAAQIKVTGSPRENFERVVHFLREAAKKKVDIICFPEDCIDLNPWQAEKKDPYIEPIRVLCKELKIHCIFGTYEKDRKKVFNCAFLIDDKGKILYRYEKIHLWKTDQRERVAYGKQDVPIRTKFGKVGIVICYDINFPELCKKLAKQGAWIIFCPTYDCLTQKEMKEMTKDKAKIAEDEPFMRAFETESFVVMADAYTKPKATTRLSMICAPDRIIKEIKGKEGMIVADLDYNEIKKLRKRDDLLKY